MTLYTLYRVDLIERIKVLDAAVEKKRPAPETDQEAEEDDELAPWPEPVDGAELLKELVEALKAHVILEEQAALAVALWILHAHAHGAASISPLLAIISPEKRCGKTTLLSILSELTPNALLAANITAAAVFRSIEVWRPTLLVDEADTFLAEREELRGVINSGHNRRSANVIRVVEEGGQQVPKRFSTWCPKAIAQIKDLPDTLQDRSVAIRLRRKLPGEKVERFRADRVKHLTDINRRAMRWAQDNVSDLRDMDVETPARLHDRAADNWRFLLIIAERIGGEWKTKAHAACMSVEGVSVEADIEAEVSDGVRLLMDCKQVFEEAHKDATELGAQVIISSLINLEESHWSDYHAGRAITDKKFANLLKPFGIKSKMESQGHNKGKKFWRRKDFEDAWKRYDPEKRENSAFQPSTPSTAFKHKENLSTQPSTTVEGREGEKLNEINAVEGVEGQNPDFLRFPGDMSAEEYFGTSDDASGENEL